MTEIEYISKCLIVEVKGKRILAVGDMHLGYEVGMGIGGLDLGGRKVEEIMKEFNEMLKKAEEKIMDKIVLLGDIKHKIAELNKEEREILFKIIDFLQEKCKELVIIKGNHDKLLESIAGKKGLSVRESYYWQGNLFIHGDMKIKGLWNNNAKRVIMGHIHPSLRLEEGVKNEIYKCFVVGRHKEKEIIVLPSFSEIGNGIDARDIEKLSNWKFRWREFRVKVTGRDGENLDFGKIKDLKKL